MNTAELMQRLQRHYIKPGQPLPGGVFVPECGWNGGPNGTRCDALYVGFTSTSGRLLVGHEVKVSRSDWLHELDQPHKAGAWADECHQWWVVAPDTDVVRVEELPDGWGLMVPGRSKTRLDVKAKARTYGDRVPSWTAVRSIIARQDTLRADAIRQAVHEAQQKADAWAAEQAQKIADRRDYSGAQAREQLAEVEEILGVKLDDHAWGDDGRLDWDGLRDACRIVRAGIPLRRISKQLDGRYANPTLSLRRILDELDAVVAQVCDAAELMPADEQPALPMGEVAP